MYDPNIFRPQANTPLPQWMPMDDDDEGVGQSTGSFVDVLKKRMSSGGATKGGTMMGAEGKVSGMGGSDSGGGMKSL